MKYRKKLEKLAARQAFYELHPNSAAGAGVAKKAFKFTKPGSIK